MEIDTTKYSSSSRLIHTSPDRTTYSMRTGINRPSVCVLVFVVSIPGCQSLNILRGPQPILVLVFKFWLWQLILDFRISYFEKLGSRLAGQF